MSSSSTRAKAVRRGWQSLLRRLGLTRADLARKIGRDPSELRAIQEPSREAITARKRRQLREEVLSVIPEDERSSARVLIALSAAPLDVAEVIDRLRGSGEILRAQLAHLQATVNKQEEQINALTELIESKLGKIPTPKK